MSNTEFSIIHSEYGLLESGEMSRKQARQLAVEWLSLFSGAEAHIDIVRSSTGRWVERVEDETKDLKEKGGDFWDESITDPYEFARQFEEAMAG